MSIYIDKRKDGLILSNEDGKIFIENSELKEFYKDLGEYIEK
jgi:hypothetical protein